MTAAQRKFTQEFKDELCHEVINTSKPIKDAATAYGVVPETLRNWLCDSKGDDLRGRRAFHCSACRTLTSMSER